MYPILIKIGPITLHTYGLMLALGFMAGIWAVGGFAKKAGLNPERMKSMAVWVVIAGLVGARLAFVVLEPGGYWDNPLRIFSFWQGGLVFYGGLMLAVPLALWLAKRQGVSIWRVADVLAPALALGQAFGRLGCFFSGDSFGKPFDGPWAITFTDPMSIAPKGIPLHPTQLYSSGALLLIFAALAWFFPRRRWNGQILAIYGLMHGVARLIIEQFRDDWRGDPVFWGLTPTAIAALLLAGTMLFILLTHRNYKT